MMILITKAKIIQITRLGSNVSLSSQDEISINEQHNPSNSCNNTYDENKINEQLSAIRQIQHDDYIRMKTRETMETHKWPTGTVLIASDSICGGLDEKRLSRKDKVQVRCFPGATINNMFYYLKPLLEKPAYVILHVSTNDAIIKTSEVILDEVMESKSHI